MQTSLQTCVEAGRLGLRCHSTNTLRGPVNPPCLSLAGLVPRAVQPGLCLRNGPTGRSAMPGFPGTPRKTVASVLLQRVTGLYG